MGIEDLKRDVAELRSRVRLMTLSLFGALAIAIMAGGGADAVAKTLVEAPAWKVSTRNLAGTQTLDRLVVTTDVEVARVQIQNANIELAQQTTPPSAPAAGSLWFDSNPGMNKLKYWNGSVWAESGGTMTLIEDRTLPVGWTSTTFSGLSGDNDKNYMLYVSSGSGNGAHLYVDFGVGGITGREMLWANSAVTAANATLNGNGIRIAQTFDSNADMFAAVWVHATPNPMHGWNRKWVSWQGSPYSMGHARIATGTNITSITVRRQTSGTGSTGTFFAGRALLYKY